MDSSVPPGDGTSSHGFISQGTQARVVPLHLIAVMDRFSKCFLQEAPPLIARSAVAPLPECNVSSLHHVSDKLLLPFWDWIAHSLRLQNSTIATCLLQSPPFGGIQQQQQQQLLLPGQSNPNLQQQSSSFNSRAHGGEEEQEAY